MASTAHGGPAPSTVGVAYGTYGAGAFPRWWWATKSNAGVIVSLRSGRHRLI